MCAGDTSALTSWEQYQCSFIENRNGYQKCWPQRRMSTCSAGQLKGAVFLYHGYSACPNQYVELAPKLQNACYHVYLILTLGHGYTNCATDGDGCVDEPGFDIYNLSQLPTERQPYIDYVYSMIDVIKQEVDIIKTCELAARSTFDVDAMEVVVGGLSFGAPLSAATVLFSGSDSIFTKQILMSPFFGVSAGSLDKAVYKCLLNRNAFRECLPLYFEGLQFNITSVESEKLSNLVLDALSYYVDVEFLDASYETMNLFVRGILSWVVENFESISDSNTRESIQEALQLQIAWGSQCNLDIQDRERGGFCAFQANHLLAVHSFASWIVEKARDVEHDQSVETMLILVERDGATRNSIVNDYVRRYYSALGRTAQLVTQKVKNCMWLVSAECQRNDYDGDIDNTCGVPHSSMSPADNNGIAPFALPWASDYHQGILDFIDGESQFGDYFLASQWDSLADQCVSIDTLKPPSSLIADVPSVTRIIFELNRQQLTESVREQVLNAVHNLTGVPRGVLELSFADKSSVSTDAAEVADDPLVVQFALDSNAATVLSKLMQYNAISAVGDYAVRSVDINGDTYNVTEVAPTTTTDSSAVTQALCLSVILSCLCLLL
eukprot:CAMPEP_0202689080 /NCGR_PEP_ID=MMETSP1385-20130828/4425_1 /ASSEMBLY_ACC=CAM_ASM_000861 /TAXON_ID=933848 /ORGANISM="Elphidium margaritaceum" /LENGTH=608 /DNA_ID=CAMNT_0049344167 /DNA_START=204 /DNA_END=2030 /DNA_ORIENTATION=+